jgi:hypothetical protein
MFGSIDRKKLTGFQLLTMTNVSVVVNVLIFVIMVFMNGMQTKINLKWSTRTTVF